MVQKYFRPIEGKQYTPSITAFFMVQRYFRPIYGKQYTPSITALNGRNIIPCYKPITRHTLHLQSSCIEIGHNSSIQIGPL